MAGREPVARPAQLDAHLLDAAGLERLRAAHQGQTICLVSHGITSRVLILEALGLGPDRLWSLHISSAGISELEFRDDWTTLHRMNSLVHLADIAVA